MPDLPPKVIPPPSSDAIAFDDDASYVTALQASPTTLRERAIVSAQLGRPARGDNAVVHRCSFGLPTVVRVGPRLEDGTPFPTVFWLACPLLRSSIGRLEAEGSMVGLNERIDSDDGGIGSAYAAAFERYIDFRDELGEPLEGRPGAGGSPLYVKCLHVHAAHTLATNDNVVGEWALRQLLPIACDGPCVSEDDVAEWTERLEAGELERPERKPGKKRRRRSKGRRADAPMEDSSDGGSSDG